MFSSFASFIAFASLASAQQAYNQILNPGANSVIQAGGGVQSLTWTNITSGNVSVSLFSGSNPVVEVVPILSNVINTGTALWTPETWLPSGNDYTIGVVDLSGSAPVQYSPYFTVQLCSTCSSSTRSTTSSFSTQTASVSGLQLKSGATLAFPTQNAAAQSQTASGTSGLASGVVASATRSGSAVAGVSGTAAASLAASLGSSANAILSQTGENAAATAATTSTTRNGGSRHEVASGMCLIGLVALVL